MQVNYYKKEKIFKPNKQMFVLLYLLCLPISAETRAYHLGE